MPMELAPLTRRLSPRRAGVDGHEVVTEVVTEVVGIGTDLARRNTERLLDRMHVDAVVMFGIAGAVVATTPIGSVIVPEVVVDAATETEFRPSPLAGLPAAGTLWTTDALLKDGATLASLRRRGVVALDMETAAVADVCDRRGVPWSVVRAVSDRATDEAIDDELLHLVHLDGTPDVRNIVRYVVRHPVRVRHLVRLGRSSRLACERAAAAALQACEGAARAPGD